jgi:hypothetical protein
MKAAVDLILVGIAATAIFEIRSYRAREDVLAAVAGFSGERAFKDLRQLVQFGPRPAGSQNLERSGIHKAPASHLRCGDLG